MILKSPYPWFGGKSKVAGAIWEAFGQVKNYVEPFYGSGAVLLGRPDVNQESLPLETINDLDSFVCNFWRSIKQAPEEVAFWADSPVNECDLHARHSWLLNRKERLQWSLEDPDFFDVKIAGWWVWGICSWIGGGWCSGNGPWVGNGVNIKKIGADDQGINRQRPHLGDAGRGVLRKTNTAILDYCLALAARFRRVRVCCGDWSRVLGRPLQRVMA